MPEPAYGCNAMLIGMTLQEIILVAGLCIVVGVLLWRSHAKMRAGRQQTPQARAEREPEHLAAVVFLLEKRIQELAWGTGWLLQLLLRGWADFSTSWS